MLGTIGRFASRGVGELLKSGIKKAIYNAPSKIGGSLVDLGFERLRQGMAADNNPRNDSMGGVRDISSSSGGQYSSGGQISPQRLRQTEKRMKKRELERSPEMMQNKMEMSEAQAEAAKGQEQSARATQIESGLAAEMASRQVIPNGDLDTISKQLDALNKNMLAGDRALLNLDKAEGDAMKSAAKARADEIKAMRAAQLSANAQLVASEQFSREIMAEGNNNIVNSVKDLEQSLQNKLGEADPQEMGLLASILTGVAGLGNWIFGGDSDDSAGSDANSAGNNSGNNSGSGSGSNTGGANTESSTPPAGGNMAPQSTAQEGNTRIKQGPNLLDIDTIQEDLSEQGETLKMSGQHNLIEGGPAGTKKTKDDYSDASISFKAIGVETVGGAAAGAAFGTAAGPVGTAVGAVVGLVAGSVIGFGYELTKESRRDSMFGPEGLISYLAGYKDDDLDEYLNPYIINLARNKSSKLKSFYDYLKKYHDLVDDGISKVNFDKKDRCKELNDKIYNLALTRAYIYLVGGGIPSNFLQDKMARKDYKVQDVEINNLNKVLASILQKYNDDLFKIIACAGITIKDGKVYANKDTKVDRSFFGLGSEKLDRLDDAGYSKFIPTKEEKDFSVKSYGAGEIRDYDEVEETERIASEGVNLSNDTIRNGGNVKNISTTVNYDNVKGITGQAVYYLDHTIQGSNQLNSNYGEARGSQRRYHHGIDLLKKNGETVPAIEDGKVIQSGGDSVTIQTADGTTYKNVHVTGAIPVGSEVQAGDSLGVTNSGHIHLEMNKMVNGKLTEVNPLNSLKENGTTVKRASGKTKTLIKSGSGADVETSEGAVGGTAPEASSTPKVTSSGKEYSKADIDALKYNSWPEAVQQSGALASNSSGSTVYAPNNITNSGNTTNNITNITNIISDQAKSMELS